MSTEQHASESFTAIGKLTDEEILKASDEYFSKELERMNHEVPKASITVFDDLQREAELRAKTVKLRANFSEYWEKRLTIDKPMAQISIFEMEETAAEDRRFAGSDRKTAETIASTRAAWERSGGDTDHLEVRVFPKSGPKDEDTACAEGYEQSLGYDRCGVFLIIDPECIATEFERLTSEGHREEKIDEMLELAKSFMGKGPGMEFGHFARGASGLVETPAHVDQETKSRITALLRMLRRGNDDQAFTEDSKKDPDGSHIDR